MQRSYPSKCGVDTKVMKNWEPLVLGPQFAILNSPGCVWRFKKFSSAQHIQVTGEAMAAVVAVTVKPSYL